MIFLDFEASGMAGFPIEVGFCLVGPDRSMRAEARLIRHDPWLDQVERWEWRAEEIHKIDRASLMEFGQPPAAVMAWLNNQLAGMVAVADSTKDKEWLDQLAEVAGISPTFGLIDDVTKALRGPEMANGKPLENLWQEAERICPKTHRADQDARHLATWYLLDIKPDAAVQRFYLTGEGYERRPLE